MAAKLIDAWKRTESFIVKGIHTVNTADGSPVPSQTVFNLKMEPTDPCQQLSQWKKKKTWS